VVSGPAAGDPPAFLPDRPSHPRGIAAILDTIVLLVLGIPSALLWGPELLMSFVPNVGFIISMIPPAILALIVGAADRDPRWSSPTA
jgi:hypothetical protein